MKKLIVLVISFFSFSGFAQQDAIYNQYLFNPFAINPAYAGSREAINTTLISRSQWVGLDGAPNTQTLGLSSPANQKNLAWGVNLLRDKLGPTNNLFAAGTIAYRLHLNQGTLNFGLRGGIYNSVFDNGILNFREENDILDDNVRTSSVVPTFDFGLYYYTDRFFAGLSITHLNQQRFNFDQLDNQEYFLRRHVFISTGYVYKTKKNILIKPSMLIKYSAPTGLNVDFNLNALFNEIAWIGFGVRNFSNLIFLTDINITDYLRIGYSYDLTLSKLKNFNNGSHEILIGFDFNLKKKANLNSPRYL